VDHLWADPEPSTTIWQLAVRAIRVDLHTCGHKIQCSGQLTEVYKFLQTSAQISFPARGNLFLTVPLFPTYYITVSLTARSGKLHSPSKPW
jgi:hypothetical protein